MNTISRRIDAVKSLSLRLAGMILLVFMVGFFGISNGGCANNSYPHPPLTIIEDSVAKTVQVAAKDGWIPCPGECLKLSKPGWHHQDIQGFAPSDYWMTYPFTDQRGASWQAYSQRHIGHIIRSYPDKPAEDVGICPTCQGTGWVRKDDPNAKK